MERIVWIMSTHKGQNYEIKWLGEPKGHPGGKPKGFAVCINIGELEGKPAFSQLDLWRHVVRRIISFCNR